MSLPVVVLKGQQLWLVHSSDCGYIIPFKIIDWLCTYATPLLFMVTLALLQAADVIIQDGQSYGFSVIMQLVTMLSTKPSDGLKGFICIVGYT